MSNGPGEAAVVTNLKNAIRQSGRSLNQLAKETGIGSDRLSRFMRGERDITFSAAGKICDALGLDLTPATAAVKQAKRRPKS